MTLNVNAVAKRCAVAASVASAFIVLALIWGPVWEYLRVDAAPLHAEAIGALKNAPSDDKLAELAAIDIGTNFDLGRTEIVRLAKQIHQGFFEVPSVGSAPITLPFSGDDLATLPGPLQLRFASLFAPHLLLSAYEHSGDEAHYSLAKDIILQWSNYERSTILSQGFHLNDHAIAARSFVLTRFWYHYRGRDDFDREIAENLLTSVSRTAEYLAKKSHYTAATNHGVMQNLALLHLTLAFPSLELSERYQNLALQRLEQQLEYYVSDEGVILEHSPGYHEFGLNLLTRYARYSTILNRPWKPERIAQYHQAVSFYQALLRDDSTLPKIGNTNGPASVVWITDFDVDGNASVPRVVSAWSQSKADGMLLPLSGYAIWWHDTPDKSSERNASQLVATWSRFPSLAHKHADDLSLTIWRSDGPWITNIGYWSYWSKYWDDSLAWPAANGPHFSDEGYSVSADTRSELLAHVYSHQFSLLDVRRELGGDRTLRRQTIRTDNGSFIIIDSAISVDKFEQNVAWTVASDLTVGTKGGDHRFTFNRRRSDKYMSLFVTSDQPLSVNLYRGNTNPFRGWTMSSGKPVPAPTVEASAHTAQWLISYISFPSKSSIPDDTTLTVSRWENPESWQLDLSGPNEVRRLERRGTNITISTDGNAVLETKLLRVPAGIENGRRRVTRAYAQAIEQYPRFKPLLLYRERASILVAILLILQEGFLFLIRNLSAKIVYSTRIISILGWTGTGAWLVGCYLV